MRTLAKTGTYSLTHFIVAISVAWALTGDLRIALAIGLIEPIVQTLAYALHERLWERLWPPRSAAPAAIMIPANTRLG